MARQSRFHGACWTLLPLGLLSGASLALAQAPGSPFVPRPDEAYEARVTRVSDGDTLWVRPLAGGTYRKLRIEGIDAPESCQEGGAAAREALAGRLLDQPVTVRERRRDDYGRALVRLTHRGEDIGAWLVGQGWAWSYRWRHNDGPFAAEEQRARAAQRGIFRDPAPEEPRDFRRRHGPCPMPGRDQAG